MDWQEPAALAIISLTALLMARRLLRRRKGGCGCTPSNKGAQRRS